MSVYLYVCKYCTAAAEHWFDLAGEGGRIFEGQAQMWSKYLGVNAKEILWATNRYNVSKRENKTACFVPLRSLA